MFYNLSFLNNNRQDYINKINLQAFSLIHSETDSSRSFMIISIFVDIY